jgi:hypothetical protein
MSVPGVTLRAPGASGRGRSRRHATGPDSDPENDLENILDNINSYMLE